MNDNNNNAGSSLTNALEIKPEELSKEGREYLGQGGFGKVYKCLWQNKEVAMKKMMDDTHKLLAIFQHEMRVMTRLNSPYIIQFYGVCNLNQFSCCIVMEYMPQGALSKVLENNTITLDWSVRTQIARDIGYGLDYLHSQNPVILHRDLNSKNVLLDNHYRAKLCDFGLAEIKNSIRSQTTGAEEGKGTPAWMAPELFNMTKDLRVHHTKESDIYSYGMVLWELAARKKPFAEANIFQMMQHVKEGGRETIPQECDEKFIGLIKDCWLSDPKKRPAMPAILASLEKAKENLSAQTDMQIQLIQALEEEMVSHKRLKTDVETVSRSSYISDNNNININSLNNSQLTLYPVSEMTTNSNTDNGNIDMGLLALSTQQNENSGVDKQSLLSSVIDRPVITGINSLPSLEVMGMNTEMSFLQQLLARYLPEAELVCVLFEKFASTSDIGIAQFIVEQLARHLPEAELVPVLLEKFASTSDIAIAQFIVEQLALRLRKAELVPILLEEFSRTSDIGIAQFIVEQLQALRLPEEQLVSVLREEFSRTSDIGIAQFIVKQLAQRWPKEELMPILCEKFSRTSAVAIAQFIFEQLQARRWRLSKAQLVSFLSNKFSSTIDSDMAQFIFEQLQARRLPEEQLVSVLCEKFSHTSNSDITQFIVKQLARGLSKEQLVFVLLEKFASPINSSDTLQFIFKQLQALRMPEEELISVLLKRLSNTLGSIMAQFILEKLEEFNNSDDFIVKKLIEIKNEINIKINTRSSSLSIANQNFYSSDLLSEHQAILNLIESEITKRTNKVKPTFENPQAESANSVDAPNFKLG